MKNTRCLLFCLVLVYTPLLAQQAKVDHAALTYQPWDARWITHPDISGHEIGVYLFKRIFELDTDPGQFIIHLSADNRYKLYVNGSFITFGPARSDFKKWRYETLDIGPYLNSGNNIIGVKVWNFGNLAPEAQFSKGTGLIVQGHSGQEKIINTNEKWRVMWDTSYSFHPIDHLKTHYVTGPGVQFNACNHPWNWIRVPFDGEGWKPAKLLEQGMAMGSIRKYGNFPKRALYPRDIPLMEYRSQEFAEIRRNGGMDAAGNIIKKEGKLTIPPGKRVSILLDQGVLTTAYPRLVFGKGNGSRITITYAESLFHTEGEGQDAEVTKRKGNRDVVAGKKIIGNYDVVIGGGGDQRHFESLWWRTFRYVQLDVETKDEPLDLYHFKSYFTAYPLEQKSVFQSDDASLSDIMDVSWRTQRLCAGETFFDCPYYEQIQYVGDTRIQGLNTFFASGDTILWKRSIRDFYDSRWPFGMTQSRYPDNNPQMIPGYSLIWILIVHDYFMHGNDPEFIESMLPAVEDILFWSEARLDVNDLPGIIEGWNFVDWVDHDGWNAGVPPMDDEGNSAIYALRFVDVIQHAVELFEHFDRPGMAARWEAVGAKVQQAVMQHCWDAQQELVADSPNKTHFSQHANVLAVLTNTIPEKDRKDIVKRIYRDKAIARCSYYYRFYLIEALKQVGAGESYFEMLDSWQGMLDNGLTTFLEKPDPSRSDCHAWSASPLYHFYSLICGIAPASPGFSTVKIAPELGRLDWVKTSFHHRLGTLDIDLKRSGNGVTGQVTLPEGLSGTFYWKGAEMRLACGMNKIGF